MFRKKENCPADFGISRDLLRMEFFQIFKPQEHGAAPVSIQIRQECNNKCFFVALTTDLCYTYRKSQTKERFLC